MKLGPLIKFDVNVTRFCNKQRVKTPNPVGNIMHCHLVRGTALQIHQALITVALFTRGLHFFLMAR